MIKCILLLTVFSAMHAFSKGYGQEKISVNLQNVSLRKAFKEIEKNTSYRFLFNDKLLPKEENNITLSAVNAELDKIMPKLLSESKLSYKLSSNLVIIAKAENIMQAIAITGKITDEKGEALIGVSIMEKGTGNGASTDINGNYKITVNDASSTLVFKYLGFETKEVSVADRSVVNVVLQASNSILNEVVVVGYGTRAKKDLTGTVSSIGGEELVAARSTNAQEAMQGRIAGVDIKRSSGKPGSDFSIEIRGANSITGSTQPLYVIDGIPVGQNGSATNPINDINPADIDRIDVLKDASSTAIYGSRGANGVVLVTTKRGSKGGLKITYDGYVGTVNPYHLPPTMDGPTFVNYVRDYFNAQQGYPATPVTDDKLFSATELSNIAAGTYTNWIDLIKRNGASSNHNISISGGDEKTSYFASAGYQTYDGTMKSESTKKYTLKAGLDKNVGNNLKFGASVYSTFANINPSSGEAFRSAYRLRPTGSAYNADGSERFFVYESEAQITNPLFEFRNEIRQQQYTHILPNVYGEGTIFKGLKVRSSFSPDITFQRQGQFNDTFSKQQLGTQPNRGQSSSNQWINYTWDNLISYTKSIGKHDFDITVGNTFEYHQQDFANINALGLPFRSLWYNLGTASSTISVGSGYSKQTIASYYGRANYTINKKYLFTGTMRADANSIFAPGHQWGYFPSAAFAWIVSEEGFMKNIAAVNFLKLRLSYGKSGNAALSGSFQPYVTQAALDVTPYDFNGTSASGFAPRFGNQDLTWEKTDEYNVGLDAQLLQSKIGLQVDLYRKTSKGSILNQPLPPPNGYFSTNTNLGSVRNQGIEVGINSTNVSRDKFSWNSSINFTVNSNKIVDLYGDGKDDIGAGRFLGEKARVVYGYKVLGVWQTNEATQAATFGKKPGQYKIEDKSGSAGIPDGKVDAFDRQILGSNMPKWFGGLTNTIKYSNFDFSFTLYTRQGTFENSIFLEQAMNGDQTRARFGAFDRSYWTPSNPSNRWANTALEQDGSARTIAQFQNSSYTKVSNITLGFNIPKSILAKVKVQNLRIYADAFNPFISSKFIGWDPENPEGSSFLNQDFRTRTFMLGLNLTL